MAIEKWLAVTSVGLFAMFGGTMFSMYNFMTDIPEDFEFANTFSADPKLIQFISIGVAPAGILAAVPFIMTRQYGSRQIGSLIIIGGVILLVGMLACYFLIDKIPEQLLTDSVKLIPILFIGLSFLVIGVGAYLAKKRKKRPKKEFF